MSDSEIFAAIVKAKEEGIPVVLATIISDRGSVPRHTGSKMLIYPDETFIGTVGGGEMEDIVFATAPELVESGKSEIIHIDLVDPARGDAGVCGGQMDIFLEPIMPEPTILVIGCGHCGQALADLANWLGYNVIVTDDRAELCTPEVIPDANGYYPVKAEKIAAEVPIHARTYIAAVTRGVPLDVAMIPELLKTPAPYIGVMGSKRRWATSVKKMKEKGISEKDLARIHAPIGLELNAETPRQIAVSIMAEIIAAQYGGTGEAMKWLGTMKEAEAEIAE